RTTFAPLTYPTTSLVIVPAYHRGELSPDRPQVALFVPPKKDRVNPSQIMRDVTVWQSWGVQPDVVMGHSIGEYVAACVAGVFSLEDALKLVANRGHLMQTCEEGRMLAVSVSEARAREIIAPFGDAVSVATINAPESVVLSGEPAAVESILASLADKEGIETKLLPIPRASHSPLMEPILAEFGRVAASITYSKPAIALCSNVTGELVSEQITDPAYWVRHLRQPVRFAESIETLHGEGFAAFLEVGPKPALLGMAGQCLPEDAEGIFIPSLREGHEDWWQMLGSLGQWYVQGGSVDWAALDGASDNESPRRKVQLPTYPFQRQRYWIDKARLSRRAGHDRTGHPLLGQKLQLSRSDDVYFESEMGLLSLPWLTDHRVFDAAVFPATGYLEMALAASTDVLPPSGQDDNASIKNITIEQALILPEEEQATIQLVLSPKDSGYRFEIFSRNEESGWTPHAAGDLVAGGIDGGQPETVDLAGLRAQCPTEVPVADHYQACRERGLNYGPGFQGITRILRGDGMALAEIELPESLDDGTGKETARYRLHPALLDAALQVSLSAMPGDAPAETYLPVGVEELRVHGSAGSRLWALARSTGSDADTATVDVSLLDGEGAAVAHVRGLTVSRVGDEVLRRHFKRQADDLYEIAWRARALEGDGATATDGTLGNWLIFADSGGLGAELAGRLEAAGNTCVLVYANVVDVGWGEPPRANPNREFQPGGEPQQADVGVRAEALTPTYPRDAWRLDPANPADFQRLLVDAFPEGSPPLAGIVHLWSLDAPDAAESAGLAAEELTEAQTLTCGSVLHLLQAHTKQEHPAKLWLVTRNAVSVAQTEDSLNIAQAPLWGMGKVIAQEHPALWGALIDDPDIDSLLAEIGAGDDGDPEKEDQIAYRDGQRYVARLVRHEPAPPDAAPALNADSTYLITGGLGALGLEAARWMVQEGARHLVLTGRRAPSEEAQAILRELEAAGTQVSVASADVSDYGRMADLFEELEGQMPLRGIIHAAGLLDDGVLEQQDMDRFRRVLAPKLAGSWNLHTLTRDRPLDFFVCFSSAASLLGNAGQGNYAAANAFMDALVYYRRALGLPGLSLNWGAWARIGLAAEMDRQQQDRLAAMGMGSIEPEEGISILGRLMGQPEAIQVGVVPTNWPRFFTQFPEVPAFLSELAQGAPPAIESVPIRQRLARATEEEYEGILMDFVQKRIAHVLGTSPSRLDVQQPLNTMGLDSLMVIELKNRFRSELDIDTPMARFLTDISALDLARQFKTQLTPMNRAPAPASQTHDHSLSSILSSDSLLEEAARQTGLTDFGEDGFREPLDILLGSLREEASLNELGVFTMHQTILRLLTNRLLTEKAFADDPSMNDTPVDRPLFILGFPRTGTTLLHNLLACDPNARWLRLWEGLYPAPAPRSLTDDPRIEQAEQWVADLEKFTPRLVTAHKLAARGPDECHWLMEHTFADMIFGARAPIPGYAEWLMTQKADADPRFYRYYRRQLQMLGAHCRGRHWVLKAPRHLSGLAGLLAVFPDARIVQTHRDPSAVLPSMCSLSESLQSPFIDGLDKHALGANSYRQLKWGAEQARGARAAAKPAQFFDVHYKELVADPIGTARRIYDYHGYEYSGRFEANMKGWLAENPQHKHGVHRYTLEEYGLDEGEIRCYVLRNSRDIVP
ncbi:MAG: Phosphopantetheine attachment site, partial [Candidatus Kentron sp. G]